MKWTAKRRRRSKKIPKTKQNQNKTKTATQKAKKRENEREEKEDWAKELFYNIKCVVYVCYMYIRKEWMKRGNKLEYENTFFLPAFPLFRSSDSLSLFSIMPFGSISTWNFSCCCRFSLLWVVVSLAPPSDCVSEWVSLLVVFSLGNFQNCSALRLIKYA